MAKKKEEIKEETKTPITVERHVERLCKDYKPIVNFVKTTKVIEKQKYIGKDGLVYEKSEVKTQSPADKFKGVKFSDFGIEQLQLVGAVDMLKSVSTLTGINSASQADTADRLLNQIENSINNNN
jgi:hypothetical protein